MVDTNTKPTNTNANTKPDSGVANVVSVVNWYKGGIISIDGSPFSLPVTPLC